ncbi:MAG: hypothetical protein E6094_13310, partial [Clostridium perfringens]|nr:hypothetical protein [Clostridium perfringens]
MRKLEKSLLIIISAILMIFLIIFNIIKNGNYIKRLNNENIELVWYTIGIEPADMDRVEREVNNYLTKKINATIDIRFVDYADFTKVMNNKTDEGENFDLVFTSSWGSVRKMRIYNVKSIFLADTNGLQTFYIFNGLC